MMTIIEVLMILILVSSCSFATYYDLTKGIVPNRLIIVSVLSLVILDAFYYSIFARSYFRVFIVNFIIMSILSLLMYFFNLWAAGDSKLLFVILLAIPGRMYFVSSTSEFAPAMFIIVFIFSLAYIYVICESIVIAIKNKNKPNIKFFPKQIVHFFKNYIYCTIYIIIFRYCFLLLFPAFSQKNATLMMFLNLFISILLFKYEFFSKKIVVVISAVVAIGLMAILFLKIGKPTIDWKIYLFLAVLILIRSFAEEYNYKNIPTETVKAGMILSYSTILMFQPSRIQGLPKTTTEDMRSRITPEMADSIKRWENSKYGQREITIVRKIPFVAFMYLGTILFLLLRVGVI